VRVLTDARNAISGGEDGNVWIWRISTGEPINVFTEGEGHPVNTVTVMADALLVVSGGDDRSVHVWDWRSGNLNNHFEVQPNASGVPQGPSWDHPSEANILDSDSLGSLSVVAFVSDDGYLRIFDYRHGNIARLPAHAKSEEEVHEYWKNAFEAAENVRVGGLSGSSRWYLDQTSGDPANPLENAPDGWEPKGGVQYGTPLGPALSVSWVPITGKTVVGYESGFVAYWDTYHFNLISTFGPGPKAGPILAVMAFQAAPYIVTGGMDGMLRKFHVPSGKEIWAVDISYGGAVRSVTIVPVSGRVVAGSDDGYVRMYDGGSGNPVCQLNTRGSRVNSVTFNPGKLGQIIVGNQDGIARVFEAR